MIKYEKAICYSGYREGQSPKTICPSKEQIEEDLMILHKEGFKYLRMYDPNLHAIRVLETIKEKKLPMKCIIGIDNEPEINNPNCPWEKQDYSDEVLKENAKRNDDEIERLINLVKEYPDQVLAVSIGNENTPSWGARIVSEERLIEHADRLKAGLNIPVTFCEGVFEWPKLQELAKHLDFISVHSYPYHYGDDVKDAVQINKRHFKEMQETFPGKQIIFTEAGWTTDSSDEDKKERANLSNQKYYLKELYEWLEKDEVILFLFEAFDEPWKGSKKESSECNWGIYTVDRTKK